MEQSEATFAGTGGLQLAYRRWTPAAEPRAALAILHGVLEHGGRYQTLVDHLVPEGFTLYAVDHRGHGRSPGPRAHVEECEGHVPRFLYGHSMGALIALDYLLDHSDAVQGAIVSGVPLEAGNIGSPLLIALARFLSRLAPRLPLPLGIDTAALSRDPAAIRAWEQDPLFQTHATARWGVEAMNAAARVNANLGKLRTPLLILHGEADTLSLVAGARRLFAQVPIEDKTLRIYPGGYHEPHNDLQREEVMADVLAWLEEHL